MPDPKAQPARALPQAQDPQAQDPQAQDPHGEEPPYAHDAAVTSAKQAAYFREQAARHRRDAERERLFAETSGGEAASEHAARAEHLETWGSQAECVAAALEGRGSRH